MYLIIIALLVASGFGLIFAGLKSQRKWLSVLGIISLVATGLLFATLRFWGDMLWFNALGFNQRFWKEILTKIIACIGGGLLGFGLVMLLMRGTPSNRRQVRFLPALVAAFLGATIGLSGWETILVYLNRTKTGLIDPILGKDTGYYLFELPFYNLFYDFLFVITLLTLISSLASVFVRRIREDVAIEMPETNEPYRPVVASLAFLLVVFAWGQYLGRFNLMTSNLGVVTGPGWTDVHVRMPGYIITALVSLLSALVLAVAPVRKRIANFAGRFHFNFLENLKRKPEEAPLMMSVVLVAATWMILLTLAPALTQWLYVEPNEITVEREFIEHNIKFTRHGFALDKMEEQQFPIKTTLTKKTIEDNRDLMSEVRLWDWRALADVYHQFQEIRLYYTFPDIDIDRYTIDGKYRQVMVSPREMDLSRLPGDSQTFVNRRFKYTHGYGLAMSTVRDFTPEGLPNLLIKDIPPKSKYPTLNVKQPKIYYGMLTDSPVVANSKEEEFDYPSGDKNVYTKYDGNGGVQISSLWRKFMFGWMFDGTRFLLSQYPTSESRMLFRREVLTRARTVAPFLEYEDDPYIVLHEGRLFWIIDAYTTSRKYPYSEPLYQHGITRRTPYGKRRAADFTNYIRNSVKVVIDAYHGDVSFYIYDEDDPIINVWKKIFPDVFKARNEMPEGLRAHVRYPAHLLLIQGLVYTKYHMTDPNVFYNQEDLWVRATEKYGQNIQPVEPYYVMWKIPGSDDPQFSLILPFSPKNKQVLIGWMAALCDGENYGRLLAYKFPKEQRLLGPQQVETKIDQDRHLSGQLTLWDQRGSRVIRGNMLAIPVKDTLLYVEPIYLKAETAAYPELRLVAVMHGDNLSYAETFDKALEGLFDKEQESDQKPMLTVSQAKDANQLAKSAKEAFENYLRLQQEKRFEDAALEFRKLQQTLDELVLEETEDKQK